MELRFRIPGVQLDSESNLGEDPRSASARCGFVSLCAGVILSLLAGSLVSLSMPIRANDHHQLLCFTYHNMQNTAEQEKHRHIEPHPN